MIRVTRTRYFIPAVFANKIFNSSLKKFHSMVRLEGIEPPSLVPKTSALSVELQTRSNSLVEWLGLEPRTNCLRGNCSTT